MRRPHQLPLQGLLLICLIPSQLCTVCEVNKKNYSHLNPLLSTLINSIYTNSRQPASVLLSLRLAGIQNQCPIRQLSQQVRHEVETTRLNISSGNLALIILALGACHTADDIFIIEHHLVRHLEDKFRAEIENMRVHNGNPLTSYYQLSLSLLALCRFNGKYSIGTIKEFFAPENKNYYIGGRFSVDTGAMAVLALTCVKRSPISEQTKVEKENLNTIENYLQKLVKKILSELREDGVIGNAFSTGAAMQALFVSPDYYKKEEWNCEKTRDTMLKETSQGTFHLPPNAALILPALLGKTYLDVNKDAPCPHDLGNVNISSQVPQSVTTPLSPSSISIHYSVIINDTYSIDVTVPNGSVFLDVMKAAQKKNKTLFGFTVEKTKLGPYVNSVQGLKANTNDRTYWEILSGGRPLSLGVGEYVVHNGENLEICWSKY